MAPGEILMTVAFTAPVEFFDDPMAFMVPGGVEFFVDPVVSLSRVKFLMACLIFYGPLAFIPLFGLLMAFSFFMHSYIKI